MSKDKNAEKINVENTGETFLALTLIHRSPPTPSFLFSTFFLSTKVGFTTGPAGLTVRTSDQPVYRW
jgi:hypothetical protein